MTLNSANDEEPSKDTNFSWHLPLGKCIINQSLRKVKKKERRVDA